MPEQTITRTILLDDDRYRVDRSHDDECWVLIDTLTGEEIADDGGEPEDAMLVRDWDWVPMLLNGQAREIAALQAKVVELERVLWEARGHVLAAYSRIYVASCPTGVADVWKAASEDGTVAYDDDEIEALAETLNDTEPTRPADDPVAAAKAVWSEQAKKRAAFMEAVMDLLTDTPDQPTPPVGGDDGDSDA